MSPPKTPSPNPSLNPETLRVAHQDLGEHPAVSLVIDNLPGHGVPQLLQGPLQQFRVLGFRV